jgi:glycosyltransferase involved in cell wall biosynthesis
MFSVIIPLHNKEKYIEKTIQSILAQSFSDFELIIVNDGSTDNSKNKVCQFNDNRIQLIEQSNSGVSITRNNGVKAAKYDYIAFLDADDWWDPSFLQEMKNLITDFPKAGIYGCNYWYVKNKRSKRVNVGLPDSFKSGYIDYFKTYSNNFVVPFNCSFVVINRGAFDNIGGFNPKLKFGEDFDLWVKIALTYNVAYINKPLAYSNQDVPFERRALGLDKLYNKEHHCIFNFGYLEKEEKINPDLKKLMDGLKVRSLINYRIRKKYSKEIEILFKNINWNEQPTFYYFVYRFPVLVVKIYFMTKKNGSKIKQYLIRTARRINYNQLL